MTATGIFIRSSAPYPLTGWPVSPTNRRCEFQECLAYLGPNDPEPKLFFGCFKGMLAEQPKGKMAEHLWSELSLIFIPENETKTLAEMDFVEYEQWYQITARNNAPDRQFVAWFRKTSHTLDFSTQQPTANSQITNNQ